MLQTPVVSNNVKLEKNARCHKKMLLPAFLFGLPGVTESACAEGGGDPMFECAKTDPKPYDRDKLLFCRLASKRMGSIRTVVRLEE